MVSTLYEIADDLKAIEDLLIEQGGAVQAGSDEDVVMEWLNDTHDKLENKLERYGRLIREFEARANARAEEAGKLRERAGVAKNAAANLRQRLQWFLETQGLKKVETASFQFSVRGNGGVQPMELLEEEVPDEFKKLVVDQTKIREALQNGEELAFAKLVERGKSLSMR